MNKLTTNKVKMSCVDTGYDSEENYEIAENKHIDAYVKYNYFHLEQKRKQKENPFLVQNMYLKNVTSK